MSMTVVQNATLASLDEHCVLGWRNPWAERARAESTCEQLRVKTPSADALVSTLSGGNQQKVALAKWMLTRPRVLLLDEPTRGVDIGAKQDVYRLMRAWTEAGISILLVTSELPELLMLSDRILVLHRGRITARYDRDEATAEAVLAAAMGRMMEDAKSS
jgi:ABC-type sugar transport system ATPase subunit